MTPLERVGFEHGDEAERTHLLPHHLPLQFSQHNPHFGIEKVAPPQAPKQLQQLLAQMGELTMLNESDLLSLVERVTLERSEALQGMVSQSYLRNATERFKQDKANTTMLFAELEQRVLDYMEGKRPAQSLRETWDWEPNSLPPSSPKPMSLPEGSLNGTNDF